MKKLLVLGAFVITILSSFKLSIFESRSPNVCWGCIWVAAVADAVGAYEGAQIGAAWTGGNPWGAGIGAGIVGGTASYNAYHVAPGDGGTDISGNPFNQIGRIHNKGLSNSFATEQEVIGYYKKELGSVYKRLL